MKAKLTELLHRTDQKSSSSVTFIRIRREWNENQVLASASTFRCLSEKCKNSRVLFNTIMGFTLYSAHLSSFLISRCKMSNLGQTLFNMMEWDEILGGFSGHPEDLCMRILYNYDVIIIKWGYIQSHFTTRCRSRALHVRSNRHRPEPPLSETRA